MSRERAFLLLRYTLILATAYLLLIEGRFSVPPPAISLMIAAALASNLFLTLAGIQVSSSPTVAAGILLCDTLWITVALLLSGRFTPDFFYLYFFVLLLAAMGEDLRLIALGALAVGVANLYLLEVTNQGLPFWHSPSLIRIPFLFTAAVFYGYLVDQTRNERASAYAVLQASEERFRVLSALTSDYAYTCRVEADHSVAIEWATAAFERITGFSPQEIEAQGGPFCLIHPEDLPVAHERFQLILSGQPETGDIRIVTKTGEVRWTRHHGYPVWDEQSRRVVRLYGAVQDITESKISAEALRASEERFRALVENAPEGITLLSPDGAVLYAGPNNRRVLGRGWEKRMGEDWFTAVHPDDQELCKAWWYRALGRPDEPVSQEFRMRRKDGTCQWIKATLCNLLDKPHVHAVVSNFRDISERKEAEEKIHQLNAQLERRVAERTAQLEATNQELEAFSYSVSHDLRAPLRAIDGFSELLLKRCGKQLDAQGRHYLQRVRKGADHMNQLINDLLALAHVSCSEIHRTTVDMSALAWSITTELQKMHPERRVQWIITDGMVVEGDAGLLRAALENLLGNAWKYTSKHATARIEFGCIPGDSQPIYFVRDDGAGFDMGYIDKLFGAFQRLHAADEFEGTGVGLATVRRIIDRHGGRVWAEGAEEGGATFYFTLPGAHAPAAAQVSTASA